MLLDEEVWEDIPEFPNYAVSNHGEIYNKRFDRIMRLSTTQHGHVKVALVNERGRFTRSVATIVAEAYLEKPNRICDRVLCLDGDHTNLYVWNLAWRSGRFVWKYARQIQSPQPQHYMNLSVMNLTTRVEYDSIIEAGMTEGLLFDDIWRSTYTGEKTNPNNCVFEIVERV